MRAKHNVLRRWLIRKLASQGVEQKNLAQSKALLRVHTQSLTRQTGVSSRLPGQWGHIKAQQNTHREIEIALRWLYREASRNAFSKVEISLVTKKQLFLFICKAPTCEWAVLYPQGAALAPLIQQLEFAKSFLLLPVEKEGCISEEELVTFGLIATDIEQRMARCWLRNSNRNIALEPSPNVQKENDAHDSSVIPPGGVRLCGNLGMSVHSHTLVHSGSLASYCSVCRQNRALVHKRTVKLSPGNREVFDVRRGGSQRLWQMEIVNLLKGIVECVVTREERENTVFAVLSAVIHSIVLPSTTYFTHLSHKMKMQAGIEVSCVACAWGMKAGLNESLIFEQSSVQISVSPKTQSRFYLFLVPYELLLHPPIKFASVKYDRCIDLKLQTKLCHDNITMPYRCNMKAMKLTRYNFGCKQPRIKTYVREAIHRCPKSHHVETVESYCITFLNGKEDNRAMIALNTSLTGEVTWLRHRDAEHTRPVHDPTSFPHLPVHGYNDIEQERSTMNVEDYQSFNLREASLRAVEEPIVIQQVKARKLFDTLIDEITEQGMTLLLTRLHWIEAVSMASENSAWAAHVMRDPTSGNILLLRFLQLQHPADANYALSCVRTLCSFRCRNLVKSLTAHSQKVASYNLQGTYSQIWTRITYVTAYVSSRLGQNVERFRNMIDPDTVQTWGKQIAAALADIHRLGVIHQNIHPDAIILDENGRMLLDDFLFMHDARSRHCNYSHGRSDGGNIARELVAPEVIDSRYSVSPKADIWAFGCCMYHWITGVLPAAHSQPLRLVLKLIPSRFCGPISHAISLALQPLPARASANDLMRVLSHSPA